MIYAFGPFELDIEKFELRNDRGVVPIEPQVFLVLQLLVENRDRMLTREEFARKLWGGRVVSDWAIAGAIKSARLAIADTGKTRQYIRTIHGRGLRFVGDVTVKTVVAGDGMRVASNTARRFDPMPEMQPGPSIAVLPFANVGGRAEDEYFADGITEDLITDLCNVPGLRVVSRNVSFAFKGEVADIRAVGIKLKVRHVLEGSVRRASDLVRINVKLVEVESGKQLWAERFDGAHSDIFALQDGINERIVVSLAKHFGQNYSGRRQATFNPEAYDLCLRGRWEYYRYTPEGLANAQSFFERAAQLDPNYAEAVAYQSYCRTTVHVFAWEGCDETLDTAEALARKAIELDGTSAVAHARLGWVLGFLGRPQEMMDSFERAVSIDPQSAEVYYAYGETMNRNCEPRRGLVLLGRALGIDTFVPPSWEFAKGHSHVLMRTYDEALAYMQPVLERAPRFIPARVQLARAYAELGRTADGADMVRTIRAYAPRYGLKSALRMFPYPDSQESHRFETALRSVGMSD